MKTSVQQFGFTLLEMVFVLAVIALLTTLAMPNMEGFVARNRLAAATGDMVTALATARTEAVGRNAPVTICASNAQATDCSDTASWEDGWLLFVDWNSNSDVDSDDEVLEYNEAYKGDVSFSGSGDVKNTITFWASGRTSISSTQTITLCENGEIDKNSYALVVSILGRARAMSASNAGVTQCTQQVEEGNY
jgi:type IV fimbrial biogenesis protein FimT